jgi:hypothetical protein
MSKKTAITYVFSSVPLRMMVETTLVENSLEKCQLGRSRCRWKDDTAINLGSQIVMNCYIILCYVGLSSVWASSAFTKEGPLRMV